MTIEVEMEVEVELESSSHGDTIGIPRSYTYKGFMKCKTRYYYEIEWVLGLNEWKLYSISTFILRTTM